MVRSICEVEHVCPEAQLQPLRNGYQFSQSKIRVDETGAVEIIGAASSKSSIGGNAECRPVVPLVDTSDLRRSGQAISELTGERRIQRRRGGSGRGRESG